MPVKARITNISRCSLHDGPGARTVVYFKGCGLRCRWCHNPETFQMDPEILYNPSKCIHCGRCIQICPKHHEMQNGQMVFLREGCIKCEKCTNACPSGALSLSGSSMTVEEVFSEIMKDKHYYESTGGGVTLSGGECLLQGEFVAQLLEKCKQEGIHTAIESSFFVQWDSIEKIWPLIDLVYADFKVADLEKHQIYTGKSNERIIANIRNLSNYYSQIIIRIPLIPGVNDTKYEMKAIAQIMNTFGNGIQGVELLKYNILAGAKYFFLGKTYESFAEEPQSREHLEELCCELKRNLLKPVNVFYCL